jgi:Rha family phage regulatory protein
MNTLVYSSKKGNPVTNSRLVAKAFGKKHKNVLQAIAKLRCDAEFSRLNFGPSTYLSRGKQMPQVVMTRAGFTFLVMGFTGQKAAEFKQGYIEQFDRMEAQLRAPQPPAVPLPEFTKPTVQVRQVKATASHLFRLNYNPSDIMQHHRGVMRLLTARTPSQYVRDAVARGLRVRSLSGRQVLRRLEPAKAATAAFMDEQVERGHTLEQLAAAGIPQALPAAFAAMLRAGITPAELPPA